MQEPPIVRELEGNRSEYADYDWLQQFDTDAEGLRFSPSIEYQGLADEHGVTLPDGISGDRQIREYLRTDFLNYNVSREHFERGLTTEEYNDFIDYLAWNTFDMLALRAQEGKSELIPRQEYEYVTFSQSGMLRQPEFYKLMIDEVGIEGIIELGKRGRQELGTKIDALHTWGAAVENCYGAVCVENLDLMTTEDPLYHDKRKTGLTYGAALLHGYKDEEGYLLTSQNRYVNDAKEPEVVEFVEDNLQRLDETEKASFKQLNGASELLTFLLHYDSRCGQGDSGPFILDDGKPMIIRRRVLNEPVYPWSEVAEEQNLPYALVFGFVIDPEEVGREGEELQELRVNDTGTLFTKPENYVDAIESVALFVREDPEQPEPVPLSDLEVLDDPDDWQDLTRRCNTAVEKWYRRTAKLSRRQKLLNGMWVYYFEWVGPMLRQLGLFEEAVETHDFWEIHPMASEIYYTCMGEIAQEVVPQDIFSGKGWSKFPETTADESEYGEYLTDAMQKGWKSDLSGMNAVPEYWQEKMDELNVVRDVPLNKMN